MFNKRGISNIIATLLLVLLTIVLVGIVWAVVSNIISSASQQSSINGLTLNLKIEQASIGQNNLSVVVQRQPGAGTLTGISFVVSDGLADEVINQNTSLGIYEGKDYIIVPQKIDVNFAKTVSVAPMYLNGNVQETGSITDTYTFGSNFNSSSGGNNIGGNTCTPASNSTFASLCTNNGYTCGDVNNGTCSTVNCGTCGSGQVCNLSSYQCVSSSGNTTSCVPTTCTLSNYQCGNPSDGCAGSLNCGTCSSGSFCNNYFQCIASQAVNNGTIYSVWPSGAPMFFDSLDLPIDITTIVSYNDGLHYVMFPNSNQPGCIQVSLVNYVSQINRSYVQLAFIANITAGDSYEIWNNQQGCLSVAG